MKAAAIIPSFISLVVLVKNAQAKLSPEQECKLRKWFYKTTDVIEQQSLVEILEGFGFKDGNEAVIKEFVTKIDSNNDGVDLEELKKNDEVTKFIEEQDKTSIDEFFADKKDAISKTILKSVLVTTAYCTDVNVDDTYAQMDTNGDGTINYRGLLSSQNGALAAHLAGLV